MEKIVVVDCGKDETKVVARPVNMSEGKLFKSHIQTRVAEHSELSELNRSVNNDIHIVEYEGKKYAVGDPTGGTNNSNSKMDYVHKIMTLTAIAMCVNNGDNVKVAIGCPLSEYIRKEKREAYLNYIVPSGRVNITVDGREVYFYITYKICFAESFGAMFLYPEKFKNLVVGIIDIGGLNVNCAYLDDMKLIIENCFTDKFGKFHIVDALQSQLNQELDARFKKVEVERAMKNGYVQNAEEKTRGMISRAKESNLIEIESACRANGWNMNFCNLIFIGGTSQMLREEILRKYPDAFIPEESGYVNAEGFMKGLCMSLKIPVVA